MKKFEVNEIVNVENFGQAKVLSFDIRYPITYTVQLVSNDARIDGRILYNIPQRCLHSKHIS